ncbi:transmembrane protein 209 [Hyalella azteca]|uniref:Transmembrane protein 209 n=1 Tax=Hyalella azteca TaxID=294128 RepID=A0A8B7NAL6_HYAAZ|nr:transmembrane protein 209 [Hyalella azteca]
MDRSLTTISGGVSYDGSYGQDSIVWQALAHKSASKLSSSALFWGAVDFVIIAVLMTALEIESIAKVSFYWWCCAAGCGVCMLSLLHHVWRYGNSWFLLPVPLVHEKQKQLLALQDHECKVVSAAPEEATSPARTSPPFSEVLQQMMRTPSRAELSTTMMDTSALSWGSVSGSPSSLTSPSHSWLSFPSPYAMGETAVSNTSWLSSPDCSPGGMGMTACSNTSWLSSPGGSFNGAPYATSPSSPGLQNSLHVGASPAQHTSAGSPFNLASTPVAKPPGLRGTPITSRKELDSYIANYQQHIAQITSVLERSSNGGHGNGGLWCSPMGSASYQQLGDASLTLPKNAYQKATPDPLPTSGDKTSNKAKDLTSIASSTTSKVWLARNVTPRQLFQYEENLRIFLCGSVVQPLVKLIDRANTILTDIAPDMQIGVVGVEKLRKACMSSTQLSSVRHISALVPLLERAPAHQHYLVTRLRQFASGGALSSYSWDRGGPGWTEQCPADAILIVQLLAFYLDSQLPVDPRESEGRVFSSRHLLNPEDKPPEPLTYPVLQITKLSPPHIEVLLPDEGKCDVGAGHKNALHCLLLFLHHLVHTQHCCLAGVNLALTGINLAWVVSND